MPTENPKKPLPSIFRSVPKWQNLRFYQKSVVLYQLTFVFCERFLSHHGDRTVDQMVQAARSGKQNIVEGTEDGKTSSAMELKLLNVARSSIGELRQDYEDYLVSRSLPLWKPGSGRFQPMQDFTRQHNRLDDYAPYLRQWTAEELANVGLTLCYQVDAMMNRYLKRLEELFITEGGVKERMHKARTGYREQQDRRLAELEHAVPLLQKQAEEAQASAQHWRSEYYSLKERALKAYYAQQEEIAALKKRLGEG